MECLSRQACFPQMTCADGKLMGCRKCPEGTLSRVFGWTYWAVFTNIAFISTHTDTNKSYQDFCTQETLYIRLSLSPLIIFNSQRSSWNGHEHVQHHSISFLKYGLTYTSVRRCILPAFFEICIGFRFFCAHSARNLWVAELFALVLYVHLRHYYYILFCSNLEEKAFFYLVRQPRQRSSTLSAARAPTN